jgi:phage shock protein A
MGIFSRMVKLCTADLHGVMDQLEDKGLLLKQHLREMEESLKQREGQLEQMALTDRRIRRELALRDQEAEKLTQELDLALRKDKDEIARMLIRKRRGLQGGSEQMQRQLEVLTEEKNRIAEILERQRLQHDELKIRIAVFWREAEARQYEERSASREGASAWQAPSDEEIELELLQRKDALRQGGAP